MNNYIGHENQIYGVEELRLCGGKGDGMRLLQVRNGSGAEITISLDRCADISRLTYKGENFGFFAPCGYVAPQYYDRDGLGFLKSFTAGFLTTCGLCNIGSPCEDAGEVLPLHGNISHTPAENVMHWIDNGTIYIKAIMRDASLFNMRFLLSRTYEIPILGNGFKLTDKVENIGLSPIPYQIMYHCNIGYPLLCEDTQLEIPSTEIKPRNAHSSEGLASCLKMEKPQRGYEEMCFYHKMNGEARVKVYNPEIGKGFVMSYDTEKLPCFTEWKMMGEKEYVLGVEPANAYPDGRDVMREAGLLRYLEPEETTEHSISFEFINS